MSIAPAPRAWMTWCAYCRSPVPNHNAGCPVAAGLQSDRQDAGQDDLGIVLSALRFLEDAVGEKSDDEGGVIAQIERDHTAGLSIIEPECGWANKISVLTAALEETTRQCLYWQERAKAATPQPAPDAMREALKPFADLISTIEGTTSHEYADKETWEVPIGDLRGARDAYLSSAPVPPPDGADMIPSQRLAHKVSGGTLFLRLPDPPRPSTELKDAEKQMIVAALLGNSPSATGAVEPDDMRVLVDQTLYQFENDGRTLYPDNEVIIAIEKIRSAIYATPPVRGDREAIARIIHSGAFDKQSGSEHQRHEAFAKADAILSLPLQPGAGERPRWKHKKRGTMYTEIGRGKLQTMDAGRLTDNEPMVIYQGDDGQLWVRDAVEFEDGRFEFVPPSRQPPQSSREG